jgi:hypothetical protein
MNSLLYLHFDVDGSLLDGARACEEDVFLSAFGNTREQLEEEYGPYEDQSFFMVVADAEGEVLGSCRLIEPGPMGLKTLNDVSRSQWKIDGYRAAEAVGVDPRTYWDIGTLGVRSSVRGRRLSVAIALYHGIVVSTRVNRIPGIIAILDQQIRRILNSADYILPSLPGATPAPYLGSVESSPVYGHSTVVLDYQRKKNPDAYRLMSLGVGLDGIVIPDEAGFLRKVRVGSALAGTRDHGLLAAV